MLVPLAGFYPGYASARFRSPDGLNDVWVAASSPVIANRMAWHGIPLVLTGAKVSALHCIRKKTIALFRLRLRCKPFGPSQRWRAGILLTQPF